MSRIVLFCSLLTSICVVGFRFEGVAHGCAAVKRKADAPVAIATESALIVWDAKTQHFIRRASFDTRAPYFGFLVPTPSKPTMAEVPDELFTELEAWTKPKVVHQRRIEDPPFACSSEEKKSDKGDRSSVEVLGEGQVAGLDYAILKADDTKALGGWLQQFGYDWTAELGTWLDPYVKARWAVTAFQNRKADQTDPRLTMKAIRMSFATERPFFPYREPKEDDARAARLLRVFFVADQRMAGALESGTWTGKAMWANPLTERQHESIAAGLKAEDAPLSPGRWLTVFDDDTTKRQDSDLYFSPAADQSALERPPIIHEQVIPFGFVCGSVCVAIVFAPVLLLWWIGRRKR